MLPSNLSLPKSNVSEHLYTPEDLMCPNVQLPKISIITPSYNQGQYLEETILSIIAQNYPKYELIIIDAGSTDNTVEVIKKYEKWITYWISEKDRGQSHAIQKGLERVTGDIVNWINSDDLLAPGALHAIARCFDTSRFDVFCGRCDYFTEKVGNWDLQGLQMGLRANVGRTLVAENITQPSTFFKSSILIELGVNEEFHFTMDLDLWYRYLLKYGQTRIQMNDKTLAYFRLHEVSKTVSQSPKFRQDINKVILNILHSISTSEPLLNYARALVDDKNFKPVSYAINIPKKELRYFISFHAWSAVQKYNIAKDRKAVRECLKVAINNGYPISLMMIRQLFKHFILPAGAFRN